MLIKNPQTPAVTSPVVRKTWIDYIVSAAKFLVLPMKWVGEQLVFIQKDEAKKRKFKEWAARENARFRRAHKLNNEF